ncbi:hypothetical protein CERSUDRAFT_161539 [Gelatoporia subvermispora B]|uniref:Uncharacterized protein n=1 Tax=Ceriporiopsis subvermispora (strain B) TaxID=914234 RepID=M2R2W3_CERS8|nr:hypothetical protein CERSUDRAFT_161539 [Gelatoporia subvermispora B]
MFSLPQSRRGSHETSLPLSKPDLERYRDRDCAAPRLSRRYARLALVALLSLLSFAFFHSLDPIPQPVAHTLNTTHEDVHPFPPLYEAWHARELALPQHNVDLPFPEGREGRYLWMSNHVHASGWGNAMQELLLNSYVAYKSGRSFVFDNYTWNRDGSDYTDFNGHLIPSRIPFSALISGPTVGGPFPDGDPAPRAVAKEYWDAVCPEPTIISSDEVTRTLEADASAETILEAWVARLNATEARCVEIARDSEQIFPIWVFGSKRVLDIFPGFAASPIMKNFAWSDLVQSALATNLPLVTPPSVWSSVLARLPLLQWLLPARDEAIPERLDGLLVLHIRRGDFADHCLHLSKWSSDWNGFNKWEGLPDTFAPPPGGGWGENTPENTALYMRRCYPTVDQIVERVEEIRRTRAGRGLRGVYVMTNAKENWIKSLRERLGEKGWDWVKSSRELDLDWEQKYVAQAVDMMIGERAQVLIGNGFSSLTSNIVMMRMARGMSFESNRFW